MHCVKKKEKKKVVQREDKMIAQGYETFQYVPFNVGAIVGQQTAVAVLVQQRAVGVGESEIASRVARVYAEGVVVPGGIIIVVLLFALQLPAAAIDQRRQAPVGSGLLAASAFVGRPSRALLDFVHMRPHVCRTC